MTAPRAFSAVTDETRGRTAAVVGYTVRRDGRTLRVSERIAFETVGDASIDRPERVEQVRKGDDGAPNGSLRSPAPDGESPRDAPASVDHSTTDAPLGAS